MLRVLLLVFQCYFLSIISVIRKKQVSEQQTHYFLKGVFALSNHLAFYLVCLAEHFFVSHIDCIR